MANNQAEFDEIVERINNGSFSYTRLNLIKKGINDADVEKLMRALQDNPKIASNISEIDLSQNDIRAISIPDTLIALQRLVLFYNKLTNIKIPASLIALQQLILADNRLSSIEIPGSLIALQQLILADNRLSSIEIPGSLIALQNLKLRSNQLSSIKIPASLIALQHLDLEHNQLSSIAIPASLIALQNLKLRSNQLSSIEIPASLIALQHLDLEHNQLSSIAIPGTLIALQYLFLTSNPLTLASRHGLFALIENPIFRRLDIDIRNELNNLPPLTKEVLHSEFFGNPEDPEQLMSKALTINSGMLRAYRNSLLTLSVKRSGLIRPELPTAVINNILSFVYVPYNYLPKLTAHRDLFPASSQERQLFDDYIKQTEEKIIPYFDRNWNYKILSLPKPWTQEPRLAGTKRSHPSAGIT